MAYEYSISLFYHYNTPHTQDKKPFQCQECSQSFNQARDLKTHTMQRHSSVRPHICGICGKGFVHKSYLMEHMSYHTGERQFQCYHCGNRFQAQSALVKHMKRHTASKDFACNNCPKAFAVKTDLKSHIRLVHEKPQMCCTMKPSPTENIEESSTLKRNEDYKNENAVMDKTALLQENNQVKDEPKENEQSLDISQSVKETEVIQDVIKSVEPDNITVNSPDNTRHLPSDKASSSNITTIVSDKTKPKAIEDETVPIPILKAAVDDQVPSVSIPTDKAKEIIPYIPNVPKV